MTKDTARRLCVDCSSPPAPRNEHQRSLKTWNGAFLERSAFTRVTVGQLQYAFSFSALVRVSSSEEHERRRLNKTVEAQQAARRLESAAFARDQKKGLI